jgi:hypothetical protein
LVEYTPPAAPDALDDLRFDRFPGLLACQSLKARDGLGDRVLTLWQSEQHYLDFGGDFEACLGLANRAWHGIGHSLQHSKRSRFVTRPWLLIVHLVAALGVINALQQHYGEFFQEPKVLVEPQPANALAGAPADIEVLLTNVQRYGRAVITILSVESDRDVGLDPVGRRVITLSKPGDSDKLHLRARCHRVGPGLVHLGIRYLVDAGHFRAAADATQDAVITMWRAIDASRVEFVEPKDPTAPTTVCDLRFDVLPGRSFERAKAHATIKCRRGGDDLAFQYANNVSNFRLGKAGSTAEGNELCNIKCLLLPLTAFVRQPVVVRLTGNARPPSAWKALVLSGALEVETVEM